MNLSLRSIATSPLPWVVMAALVCACTAPNSTHDEAPRVATTTPTIIAPTISDEKPRDYAGLHNVVAFHDGFYSGSVPEGEEGFETLAAMGVKTVISVDGAEPKLAEAKAHGLRYIHLPVGYNGFDEARTLELVRATRDAISDGPVYIHCHHGKHRSAGAAGTIAASLGWMSPQSAVARMNVSGTGANYTGLYACTANAVVLSMTAIDAVPAHFPEVSRPAGFVKMMVELDTINDNLKAIEKAGWVTPGDHPDLVPVAEAARMADLLRLASESKRAKAETIAFMTMLATDSERAQRLEDMLAAGGSDPAALSVQLATITSSCVECHRAYRD